MDSRAELGPTTTVNSPFGIVKLPAIVAPVPRKELLMNLGQLTGHT